ncbi:MAG: tRNA dihydrouridine(20/20a) synthase DusA [Rhodospirillales bacterium]|nr:tRNA dihydrouridine(20/20a) synthase DusA [Rhodospirillales bacterium]MDH3911343.1 tRNA dihydrouridine(20/20a) synthase DusA [Rhodospirillales bacterium]
MQPKANRRLSVAPMMDWTDRHCRFFLRLISQRVLLYTEMVPTGAIVHGDRARFLGFHPAERPLALQLGGAEPVQLAECAEAAAAAGYDEVNLNVGCPSDRVQNARFGACLMAEPALVARCVAAMAAASGLPVTVKTRTGIDARDSYAELKGFVGTVAAAGCRSFTVHARKAWLQGLSPKQNRELPPLDYDRVYRLKEDFRELEIVLNGGVQSLDEAQAHLARVDGVMIGRAAYQNPYVLAEADRRLFGEDPPPPGREAVVRALLPYAAAQCAEGVPVKSIIRHILGLFNGLPGARAWRRHLSEAAHRPGAGPEVIEAALEVVLERLEARGAAA